MTTNRMGLEQALSDEQSLRYEQLLKDARMFREAYESASEIIRRKERHIEQLEAVIKMHKPTRAVPVPDGWQLVPTELTAVMRDAWDSAPNGDDDNLNMQNAYRAMIAVAPSVTNEP